MGRASPAYIGLFGLILAWHGAKELSVFFPYPYTIVENAILPSQGCFLELYKKLRTLQIMMKGTQIFRRMQHHFKSMQTVYFHTLKFKVNMYIICLKDQDDFDNITNQGSEHLTSLKLVA
jgi:hypothetical protein